MDRFIAADPLAASERVAEEVLRLLAAPRPVVLGVAAGATPRMLYRLLVEARPSVGRVDVVLLDEYVGVGPLAPHSFRQQIHHELTGPLGVLDERVHSLNGLAPDPVVECEHFERLINRLGGIDLQLLGIGRNGHIGFNEPGALATSRSRVVDLTSSTREANAGAFGSAELVPMKALTQGLGTISDADRVILMAFGDAKAEALAAAVDGPVTAAVPASILQTHPNALVVADQAAARLLRS